MAVFSGFRPFLNKGSTVNGVQNIFFSDGTPGAHYLPDPTDLYGVSNFAAFGEGVSAVLDKKNGVPVLGTELIINGNFSSGASWTAGTGWTISGDVASANIATGSNLDQSLTTTANRTYQVTYTITNYTSGGIRTRFTGAANVNGTIRNAVGTYTELLYATVTNNIFRITDSGAGFVGSINNISVREVPGFHTLQPSASLRPLLGKAPKSRRNTFTDTEASVTASNATATQTQVNIGTKTISGWSISVSSVNGTTTTGVSKPYTSPIGVNITLSVYVRPLANRYIYVSTNHGGQPNVGVKWRCDTETGLATVVFSGNIQASFIRLLNLGNGLFRVEASWRSNNQTNPRAFAIFCSNTSETTGTTVYISPTVLPNGSFEVAGWQRELGAAVETQPSATVYQTVDSTGTITTEDSVTTFPFIRFDLSDDRLDTVLPQSVTGDIVIAGRNGSVIEPINYTANTTFQFGPTSYTSGTPGILRAVGDVVGYSLIGRSTTAVEQDQLIDFYKFRGAKGLLVANGPELVVNGGFDTDLSGWTSNSWTWENGAAKSTNNTSVLSSSVGSTGNSKTFLVSYSQTIISGTRLRSRIRNFANSLDLYISYISGTVTTNLVIVSPDSGLFISFLPEVAEVLTVDNISVRELRPEEEW